MFKATGPFRPMGNEHVPTWAAPVYTVHVIMFPRASASVYIVTILLSLTSRQPAGNFTSLAAEMSVSCKEFQDTVIKASLYTHKLNCDGTTQVES